MAKHGCHRSCTRNKGRGSGGILRWRYVGNPAPGIGISENGHPGNSVLSKKSGIPDLEQHIVTGSFAQLDLHFLSHGKRVADITFKHENTRAIETVRKGYD
jgi:hypothetical protein